MSRPKRFIDIGANLTDLMYSGVYNSSKKHDPDLKHVLERGWTGGLSKIVITGGSLSESIKSLELAQTDDRLFSTVGCHPTRCLEFEQNGTPEEYLQKLHETIKEGKDKIVAVGECGLDYDRIQFCPKEVQQKYFEAQLKLCQVVDLPLFLHCRNAADDLYEMLKKYPNLKGVVHSFDGSVEEAKKFIDLGYYIGLNGCSLKTKANLDTVCGLPADRILIETDCPWCDIRPTHAGYQFISEQNRSIPSVKKEKWISSSMVKGRNEPINIRQVLDVIAGVRKEDASELCEIIYNNTLKLFPSLK